MTTTEYKIIKIVELNSHDVENKFLAKIGGYFFNSKVKEIFENDDFYVVHLANEHTVDCPKGKFLAEWKECEVSNVKEN